MRMFLEWYESEYRRLKFNTEQTGCRKTKYLSDVSGAQEADLSSLFSI